MGEVYTTGWWKPKDGEEQAFVAAWLEVARWASEMPGAGTLRLARDNRGTGHYLSMGRWESIEQVHAWKGSPEFQERLSRVQQHVEQFSPSELEVVATIADG
jgi:heme-degrading monooxygenase HmoA